VVAPTVPDKEPVTAGVANAVLKATEPPVPTEPETTRNALSLFVVNFVKPVGAAVCENNITVPAGIVVPPAAGTVLTQVVPLLDSTLPLVLGATNWTADVPLPSITLLAVSVANPVPPLVTGNVPVTPVVRGSPVAFVSVPEVGVPRIGVTKVGLVDRTLLPEPVEVDTPVPPLATGRIPVVAMTETVTKSTPFQATRAAVPATMVTPVVGPAPTILMLCVLEVLLITM
jgi:hypothetical protein